MAPVERICLVRIAEIEAERRPAWNQRIKEVNREVAADSAIREPRALQHDLRELARALRVQVDAPERNGTQDTRQRDAHSRGDDDRQTIRGRKPIVQRATLFAGFAIARFL